ncbi:uncharacterized protein [Nicotiana tomentosiformis]|uniref:uncharacterized protein n=1 Tax=Nicotiana tomentosiformis TaxID=4098 RepID=UPI00388CC4BB
MHGAVEASNKNIKRIMRKIVENHRQWHEKLSSGLSYYNENIHWETPYMLVYGTEAMIPAEVEIPSLRDIQEAKLDDVKWIRVKHEQLILIDEKRMDTVCHGQLYQNRMASAFNKKVKHCQFTPGQLVLKKIFLHQEKAKGNFAPNWKGPYVVHRVLSGGSLSLAKMDGIINTKPINSDVIKRYYV